MGTIIHDHLVITLDDDSTAYIADCSADLKESVDNRDFLDQTRIIELLGYTHDTYDHVSGQIYKNNDQNAMVHVYQRQLRFLVY